MRTGVPCNENRFFPVRIDLQGVPCKPYRNWVCSVLLAATVCVEMDPSFGQFPMYVGVGRGHSGGF